MRTRAEARGAPYQYVSSPRNSSAHFLSSSGVSMLKVMPVPGDGLDSFLQGPLHDGLNLAGMLLSGQLLEFLRGGPRRHQLTLLV